MNSYMNSYEAGVSGQREGFEDVILLALKVEEGATSQGMQAASNGWKSILL